MFRAWYVPLGFDKFYPGDVSGLTVILWADTGEICGLNRVIVDRGLISSLGEKIDTGTEQPISASAQQPISLPNGVGGVSAAIGMVCLSVGACKWVESAGNKKRSSKFWAILLCVSIAFSVLFFKVPPASATISGCNSRTYAVPSANGYSNGTADSGEAAAALNACNNITSFCSSAGYTGRATYANALKQDVLNTIDSDEANYDGTIVFHAGHTASVGYQDNSGNPANAITPSDVLSRTDQRKHFFAFIWVCNQAPDYGIAPSDSSMAAAWTHRTGGSGLDNNGYGIANSDGQGQCYISFYGFSPMLSAWANSTGQYGVFYENSPYGDSPCEWFIEKVYFYALVQHFSVYESLDMASWDYFGESYLNSPLNNGYNSWWPGGSEWLNSPKPWLAVPGYYPDSYDLTDTTGETAARGPNRMRVFGDSTVKLYQPLVHLSAVCDNHNYETLYPTFTLDGQGTSSGDVRLRSKTYSVSVSSIANYQFSYFSYNGGSYGSSIPLTSDGNLVAHYTWSPSYRYLTVSSSNGGTTSPSSPSPIQYIYNDIVTVYAYPNSGYEFSGWTLDGLYLGTNPSIQICMADDLSLYASFTPAVQYHWLTVNGYHETYGCPESPNVYLDSPTNWIGTAPLTVQVTAGTHSLYVDGMTGDGGIFTCIIYQYHAYQNGQSFSVSSDATATACYYAPMFRGQEEQEG